MSSSADVTQLLIAMREGEPGALDKLMPLVYDQLRRLAHARLRDERTGHTLNTTGLVHEAYLELIDINRIQWEDRTHFFAMASRTMRRILIDYATARKAYKRGGTRQRVEMEETLLVSEDHAELLLELDDFIEQLKAIHLRQSQVLEHRYFGGLSNEEIADVLGVSLRTVERDLRFAKTWLARLWDKAPEL